MTPKRLPALSVTLVVSLLSIAVCSTRATAQLLIDFNSLTQGGGPNHQEGYQPYDAGHEVSIDFDTKDYDAIFFGEEVTVSVTPDWPNTTDNRVRQSIDRGAGNDANWLGDEIDLITDFIGIDSRTGNGGNGDWDRTEFSTPTYMTLTLSGLPGGEYEWLSLHHDTEHVWSDFQVEVSIDGGFTYSDPEDLEMTDSTPAGSPASPQVYQGDDDPDPRELPSTFFTSFTAEDGEDVVLRFAPFADGVDGTGVHKQIFAMNAFELTGIGSAGVGPFIRADSNGDVGVNVSDPVFTLNSLFAGGDSPPCFDAADANDDGGVNITDAVYTLNHLFASAVAPPAPYPDCGTIAAADSIGCDTPPAGCQ